MAATRFVWLDLARGLSALVVCAGHLRLATMCSYDDLPDPTFVQTAFYLATGLATPAVMVFFVLSGMMVGGSVLRAGESFSTVDYAVARLTRLWVALVPALLFTLLIDSLTLQHAPQVAEGAYFGRWTSGPPPDGSYTTSLLAFLGNMAFLNTIALPSYGTNGPLWTLAAEFWYYVLFPLIAIAAGLIGPRGKIAPRIAAVTLAAAVAANMPPQMASGFLVWLMGVAAAVVARRPAPASRWKTAAAFAAFLLSLAYGKLDHFGFVEPIPSNLVVGAMFALLAVQLVRLSPPPGWLTRIAVGSSEISYSLYLIHFPLTVYLATRWHIEEMTATAADLFVFFGWFCSLVFAGWLFWLPFERHTGSVRRWVRRRLG